MNRTPEQRLATWEKMIRSSTNDPDLIKKKLKDAKRVIWQTEQANKNKPKKEQ